MTMAHSVEARPPLLDHRLVEFAATIPARFRLRDGTTKYLFKQAMRGILPDRIIDRPKQGFAVPLAKWLREDLAIFARDILLSDRAAATRHLQPAAGRAAAAAEPSRPQSRPAAVDDAVARDVVPPLPRSTRRGAGARPFACRRPSRLRQGSSPVVRGVVMSHPPHVAIVAASLDILGGQGVQARALVESLRADGQQVMFVPINPRFPRPLWRAAADSRRAHAREPESVSTRTRQACRRRCRARVLRLVRVVPAGAAPGDGDGARAQQARRAALPQRRSRRSSRELGRAGASVAASSRTTSWCRRSTCATCSRATATPLTSFQTWSTCRSSPTASGGRCGRICCRRATSSRTTAWTSSSRRIAQLKPLRARGDVDHRRVWQRRSATPPPGELGRPRRTCASSAGSSRQTCRACMTRPTSS